MNIAEISFYPYSLSLHQPMIFRDRTVRKRDGYILRLKTAEGFEGVGEIAPLPGFSRETCAEAEKQLRVLKTFLVGKTVPESLELLDGRFEQWLSELSLCSSVRFGVESAILHVLSQSQNLPLNLLIDSSANPEVCVTGLLNGTTSNSNLAGQAKNLVEHGFRNLKLKIGGDVERDAADVQSVNSAVSGKALLHVDANQKWDYDQALQFGKKVGCAAVTYIEEPFKDLSAVPDFFEQTMIPVALDESLLTIPFEKLKEISGVETIVIKPTIIGGIERAWQLIRQAQSHGIHTVISSAFETSVGLWTLANMASVFHYSIPAGLDTLKWFEEDVFKCPIPYERGTISIGNHILQTEDIDFASLQEAQ